MKRYIETLITILFTGVCAIAEQKTVTICTVNNPDMIELKKAFSEVRGEEPGYKTQLGDR
jgi:hypothetical protein